MSGLHERFMATAGPTDVLTFPLDEDERGRCVAGEVVVCVPEARRQAKARVIPVEHEVLLYAIHGMLHLSGFDDRTQTDYRKMHRTEDRILTKLGVGPIFHASARPQRRAGFRRNAAKRGRGGRSRGPVMVSSAGPFTCMRRPRAGAGPRRMYRRRVTDIIPRPVEFAPGKTR